MKKGIETNKGITLIALIVTIIVLLILAGVAITTLTGENGILNKSNTAAEETKKREYEEILKLIANGLRADKIINNWSNKIFLDEVEKEIRKEDKLQGAEIIRKNDETIRVITKEKYIFDITENEVKIKGIYDGVEPPTLQTSNVTFKTSTDDWTNQNVEVEIITSLNNYDLEYSLDAVNWQEYTKTIIMEDNGAIHARLIDAKGVAGGMATKNITNIDREPPTVTFSYNIEEPIVGDDIICYYTVDDNSKILGNSMSYYTTWQKYLQNNDKWVSFGGTIVDSSIRNLPYSSSKSIHSENASYRLQISNLKDKAGNEVTLYSEPIIVRTNKEALENKVNENKEQNGQLDYEKLKEDLDSIKNIIGVPDKIDDSSFPLIVQVDGEFIQINKDGTTEPAKEIDVFTFASNAGITDWSKLGINIQFLDCEQTSISPGWIGGGRTSFYSGNAQWGWNLLLDKNKWFSKTGNVTITARFWLNPCFDGFNGESSWATGYIGTTENGTWGERASGGLAGARKK